VVHPRAPDDVAATMRIASANGGRVTVRGGGLSSNCVSDDSVMVDLSVHLAAVRPQGDRVVVGGGATVGTAFDALAQADRVIPVGIVGFAGFGLLTRGGVGYLTRGLGLALDHLVEVELVLPSCAPTSRDRPTVSRTRSVPHRRRPAASASSTPATSRACAHCAKTDPAAVLGSCPL